MRDRAALLTNLPHCLNRLFSAIITFIVYSFSDLNDLFRRKFIGLDLKRVTVLKKLTKFLVWTHNVKFFCDTGDDTLALPGFGQSPFAEGMDVT
jgi:hypothetical protein